MGVGLAFEELDKAVNVLGLARVGKVAGVHEHVARGDRQLVQPVPVVCVADEA